jgi:hypothetical protein
VVSLWWGCGFVFWELIVGGSCGVFQGILRKMGVLRWFFDGENVVECVVKVVFWQALFTGEKMRQVLGFISGASRFGNSGFEAQPCCRNSVRYLGASAPALAFNSAWVAGSSFGGGVVRVATGTPTWAKNSS